MKVFETSPGLFKVGTTRLLAENSPLGFKTEADAESYIENGLGIKKEGLNATIATQVVPAVTGDVTE